MSRFDEQVRRTPDAIAVSYLDRSLTYRALDAESDRVAHHLRSLGIEPGELVAICLPRSEWLVVGLLGTLKAGAAYLPIDVAYPEERVAYVLEDSGARVVLTDGSRPGLDITRLIAADTTNDQLLRLAADQLAYVIYTSGSTGRPKGTMVSHGGAGALSSVGGRCVSHDRRVTVDRALLGVVRRDDHQLCWTPLLVGGIVELVPDEQAVHWLARALASEQTYDLVKITPAHLDLLRHELGEAGPRARVGAFVIGGEALLDTTLAWWRRVAPHARLINEYGPTETVVGCAIFEDRGVRGPAAVPIGRPIDRMRLAVLDTDLEPVPLGTVGEIFIGGAGVARGYLGRPDLTAERFLPDPTASTPGARMYRTGDTARWRPDGELEYLGRNDFQVKVRGHRVELGEVEAVLSEHPSVSECAVVAQSVGGSHELIGFVVGADPTLDSLRTFLARRLPEPLIPGRFVMLAALPLTTHGKVDRQALLGLEAEALSSSTPFVAPRTEAEQALAAVWAEVLHRTQVGVRDDYFAHGGDSLKALQIVSRAARDGWRLRVRDVFDYPTIAELARHAGRDVLRAAQGPVVGAVALTPIQHWFFEDHPGPYHHFNQAVSLKWRGRVDVGILVGGAERACRSPRRVAPALRRRGHHLASGARTARSDDRGRGASRHGDDDRLTRRSMRSKRRSIRRAGRLCARQWCAARMRTAWCWRSITWWSTACRGGCCSRISMPPIGSAMQRRRCSCRRRPNRSRRGRSGSLRIARRRRCSPSSRIGGVSPRTRRSWRSMVRRRPGHPRACACISTPTPPDGCSAQRTALIRPRRTTCC